MNFKKLNEIREVVHRWSIVYKTGTPVLKWVDRHEFRLYWTDNCYVYFKPRYEDSYIQVGIPGQEAIFQESDWWLVLTEIFGY